ncbi:multidrug transporter, partial [Staphylococcus aureus]
GIVLFIIPEYVGNPVLGVAVVTAFSRLLGCTLALIALIQIFRPFKHYFKLSWKKIYQVSTLGIPTAGEQISYNFAQTFTTAFIAMLGTQVIAAKSVSTVLSGLSFSCAMAFSAASQIYLGKFISRRRYRTLKKVVIKSIWFNITQSFMIMTCVFI